MPDSVYCYPTDRNKVVLRLRIDKNDEFDRVEVVYGCKYTITTEQKTEDMRVCYTDRLFCFYETELTLDDVRLVYVFRLTYKDVVYYFSEDGISTFYNFKLAYYNSFQLPYINSADVHSTVDWMRSAVFYQIFVDRFNRGDIDKDDTYINMEWFDKPTPKSFAGGDIAGITKELDYIAGLGANVIYLTPVFCACSNHKYDISDYYNIDRQFGTNEDFRYMVKQAHARGVRVVLDAVFNHCSMLLPQFQDVQKRGRKSEYYDWFIIKGDKPDPDAMNYEVFAFCNYMPKFNTSNGKVQRFLLDIATHWIKEYDIDGWRLDVSDEISHDFWRLFRKEIKNIKSDCVIIGENWHDAATYLRGDQYDGIMNYAFTKACLDYFAFGAFDAQSFAWKLNSLLMRNTGPANTMMLNLLDSHDTDRFFTTLKKNSDRLLAAVAVMCMYVGAVCIYYGTEICMEGGYDPDNRRGFDLEKAKTEPEFLRNVRQLLKLKRSEVLRNGSIKIESRDGLFVILREHRGEAMELLVNMSGSAAVIKAAGEIVAGNRYTETEIKEEGFIILQREQCMED